MKRDCSRISAFSTLLRLHMATVWSAKGTQELSHLSYFLELSTAFFFFVFTGTLSPSTKSPPLPA